MIPQGQMDGCNKQEDVDQLDTILKDLAELREGVVNNNDRLFALDERLHGSLPNLNKDITSECEPDPSGTVPNIKRVMGAISLRLGDQSSLIKSLERL